MLANVWVEAKNRIPPIQGIWFINMYIDFSFIKPIIKMDLLIMPSAEGPYR